MSRHPAVLCDRDGTLASVAYIAPHDKSNEAWQQYNAALRFDAPIPAVVGILRAIRPGLVRIMVSGRAEGDWPGDRRRRFAMQDWIAKHEIPVDRLFMRGGGDTRIDSTVKREMYEREIAPLYDVRVVIDDRPLVIAMWRSLGLTVIAVRDPEIMPPITCQRGSG